MYGKCMNLMSKRIINQINMRCQILASVFNIHTLRVLLTINLYTAEIKHVLCNKVSENCQARAMQ